MMGNIMQHVSGGNSCAPHICGTERIYLAAYLRHYRSRSAMHEKGRQIGGPFAVAV
jgi:hypothetical protein